MIKNEVTRMNQSDEINESKKIDVSIVLPTYNEALTIKDLIERINNSVKVEKEIIVVDDDSPDKTWGIVEGLKDVKLVRRTTERGLVTAIQRGIDEAKGKYVLWMDADGSMPPEVIPKLLRELDKGYGVAVGSRYIKGGKDKRPLLRVVSSRFINLFANVFLNFKVLDYDSGFVATRREVLNHERLDTKAAYGDYCIKFLYNSSKKHRIKEIPYFFVDRRAGESKTAENLFGLFKYGLLYMKMIVALRFKK